MRPKNSDVPPRRNLMNTEIIVIGAHCNSCAKIIELELVDRGGNEISILLNGDDTAEVSVRGLTKKQAKEAIEAAGDYKVL